MTSAEAVHKLEQDELVINLRRARASLRAVHRLRDSLERQITTRALEIDALKRWAYQRGLDPLQEATSDE